MKRRDGIGGKEGKGKGRVHSQALHDLSFPLNPRNVLLSVIKRLRIKEQMGDAPKIVTGNVSQWWV